MLVPPWKPSRSIRSPLANRPIGRIPALPRWLPPPAPWWRECYSFTSDLGLFRVEPPVATASGCAESVWVVAPGAAEILAKDTEMRTPPLVRDGCRDPEATGIVESRDRESEVVSIDDVHAGQRFNRKLAAFDANRFLHGEACCVAWIRWGDGEINLGSILRRGSELWVCGSHLYSHAGHYEVRVTLSDGVSQALTKSAWLQVAEPIPCSVGDPVKLRGLEAVAPAGRDARLALAEVDSASSRWSRDWTSVIEWGDGSSSGGQLMSSIRGGIRIVGQHRYLSSGRFSTRVTLADSHGRLAHATGIVWVAG